MVKSPEREVGKGGPLSVILKRDQSDFFLLPVEPGTYSDLLAPGATLRCTSPPLGEVGRRDRSAAEFLLEAKLVATKYKINSAIIPQQSISPCR